MSERLFLDGYSGQSVAELLALEDTHRIDSIVLAFEAALESKAARDGVEALTVEELTVLAIEGLEREVNNGGYDQFFVNSSVQYVPHVVAALRRIGCSQVADITEAAIAALRLPANSAKAIEAVIYDHDPARDDALRVCDQQYFAYPEPIGDRLFAFIKANRSRIQF